MRVAVIGGGVIGVCTAYFLAAAGHDTVVVERCGNVAEQASFGHAGLAAPGVAVPWAAPGMPGKILSSLFKSESPFIFRPRSERAWWRWVRQWLSECDLERYRLNLARMQRVACYSRDILHALRERHRLEYEQTPGYLQLFRTARDVQLAGPAVAWLAEHGIAHRLVDPEAARAIEPALSLATPLAGGLHLPHDETGNCPLFAKQMRHLAQEMGATFHFNATVSAIRREGGGMALRVGERSIWADAIVVAAGVESVAMLAALGIRIPLYPVKGYSATASIKNFDAAPCAALMDESYQVAITRLGTRIRVAGLAELGARGPEIRNAAMRTLIKVGEDWFAHAANYHAAHFWCGVRPMLPDGAPLLGAAPVDKVFVNLGHGSSGWAMAAGAGKIVADLVSGREAEIDMDGLTLARYGYSEHRQE